MLFLRASPLHLKSGSTRALSHRSPPQRAPSHTEPATIPPVEGVGSSRWQTTQTPASPCPEGPRTAPPCLAPRADRLLREAGRARPREGTLMVLWDGSNRKYLSSDRHEPDMLLTLDLSAPFTPAKVSLVLTLIVQMQKPGDEGLK